MDSMATNHFKIMSSMQYKYNYQ